MFKVQTEFAIIKNEEQGFFVAIDNSPELKRILTEDMGVTDIEHFWETYDEEDGARLFTLIVANNIPYEKTGWQGYEE